MGNTRATKLIISGFESFADTVEIDLSMGAALAVDKYGMGIADICDALCFVTGRSLPVLRSRQGVIFPGSADRRPAEAAEVTLCLSADGEDHVIRRTLNNMDETFYFADEEEVSEADIRSLASDAGIYGYSLINRNVISDIITSRSGSLAELISRASGAYGLRRELSRNKESAEEKKKRLKAVTSMLEEYAEKRKKLKDEVLRVNDYDHLNEQLRTNEINIILRRVEQCDRNDYTDTIQINELEERIAESEKTLDDFENKIAVKKEKLRELDKQDADNRDRVLAGMEDINNRKSEISVVDGRIETVTGNIDILNKDIVSLRERMEEELQSVRKLRKEGGDIAHNIVERTKKQQLSEDRLKARKLELADKQSQYEDNQTRLSESKNVYEAAKAEVNGLKRIIEKAADQRESIINAIDIKEEETPDEAVCSSISRKRDSLKADMEQNLLSLSSMKKSLAEASEKTDKLREKYRSARSELISEKSRSAVLEKLDEDYDGYSSEARTLLAGSSLSGIYGTAGELLNVSRGYESVISAALGRHIQDIICGDEGDAAAAAKYLRDKNAGRLVFIPIKDIEYKPPVMSRELLSAEGCLGRALDFVDYKAEYTRVFGYLLGNTVIFRSVDDAAAAGRYSGIRAITMDNQIISENGVIEGGSMKNAESLIFERKNKLRASKSRIYDLERDYKSAKSEYERAAEDEKALKKNIKELTAQTDDNEEITDAVVKSEISRSLLSSGRRDISRLRKLLIRNDDSYADLPAELKAAEKKRDEADAEIKKLEQISEKLYSDVEKLKSAIRGLESELKTASKEKNDFERDMSVNELTIGKIEKVISAFESDIKKKTDFTERVKGERAALIRQKEDLEQKVRIMEMNFEDKSSVLGEFREELDDTRTSIDKLENEREKASRERYLFVTEKRAVEVQRESERMNAERMKKELYDTWSISYSDALDIKDPVFVLSEGLRESGHIRNSLADLGPVNTGAPLELEKVTAKEKKFDGQRRHLEDEISELSRDAARLETEAVSRFTNLFEAANAEFKKIFREVDPDAKAYMHMDEITGTSDVFADIYIRRTAQMARRVGDSAEEDQISAFISLMAAIYSVNAPSVTFIDNVDSLMERESFLSMLSMLGDRGGSLIAVTGDPERIPEDAVRYDYTGAEIGEGKLDPAE